MQYPKLRELETDRRLVDTFRGYNHNLRISDGEFFDMKNMTSDYYPILSPRGKRGVYASPENPQGMIFKDALCYVDGPDFVIGNDRVEMGLSTAPDDCPKHLVSMGAYVIIMPDKMYVNTQDLEDRGAIEASFTANGSVSFDMCDSNGNRYAVTIKSNYKPEKPTSDEMIEGEGVASADKKVWIDMSKEPYTLNAYSAAKDEWVPITPYTRVSAEGIGKNFAVNDGVKVSGVKDSSLQFLDGNVMIHGCGDDYLVVQGLCWRDIDQSIEDGTITVKKEMPVMDFMTESGNRLWGCRYGVAANGEFVNEIYASKLGDFRNWNCFQGLSTDSYAASCGTDGPFTGAITFLGHPLFFKENCVHKVYGNYPANYQIQSTACRGVQKGSHKSLAIVNETLFYKSRGAVCAYDGSLPAEASYALGNESYSDAVAGSHGNKYYISMKDAAGGWNLFVYDAGKNMWHREDGLRSDAFCSGMGEIYAIDHDSRKIIAMMGTAAKENKSVEWMVQTGPIGTDMPDMKYVSRLLVRMSMAMGTRVRFFIQYDSMGGWDHICTMNGNNLRSFSIPIRPRRCDHLRLRIEGEGDARIYSITKTIEQGSDIS